MIKMRGVTKIYEQHDKPALDNVDVDIEKGEFVFVVGPSGSGKTTFIRLLIKEILPTKGEIFVAGQDVVHLRSRKVPLLRRNIGCVFQDFKLLPNKTAYENVAFALDVIGRPERVIRSQTPEVLKLVGLEKKMNSYPDELSGGEQQRVSLARAFVNRPPLLLADEPTGNLDPAISRELISLLDRINRTGTTVVVATHDREIVNFMRKRVVALEEGKVVRDQLRGVYGHED
ncbi:MAG TPA: cell division ATP-binding protein FtsE [Actinobacteria bacterium]|nr:cell division ATP-binding protein FtsE [Actinomycetota bacterium]